MPEGLKFDGEKCRMELFPPDAYEEICNIFTFGAKKYGDYQIVRFLEFYNYR